MALLSELVAICAEHGLDSEPTLTQFARELREAGRVSKAGRGRGAARMTFLDGARFVIACAATDHPKRAAETEAVFSNLLLESGTKPEGGWALPAKLTLDLALAQVLEVLASGKLDDDAERDAIARARFEGHQHAVPLRPMPELRVDRSAGWAEIALFGASHRWVFYHPTMVALMRSIDALEGVDRANALQAELEQQTLRFRTGKNLQAKLEPRLLRAVSHAIAGTPTIVARQTVITVPGAPAPGQTEERA